MELRFDDNKCSEGDFKVLCGDDRTFKTTRYIEFLE